MGQGGPWRRLRTAVGGAVALAAGAAGAAAAAEPGERTTLSVSADQLLDLAERARASSDFATAEKGYRALFADPSVELRSEARFRLATMLAQLRRLSEAAVLLREILDEQPGAQRVRLELARLLDLMGDEPGARRALREAQAGGLPPEVARFVDRYSAALRARKPLGASIDIALAPDSNINRATRSDTLGTVLGEFDIDEDARPRSGLGLALRGQGYGRLPIGEDANLFGRISASADLYRDGAFNDVALAASAGPELRSGADRLSIEAGALWRWYGGRSYSRAATIGLNLLHPMGRKAQLRAAAGLAFVDNRFNPLQDGRVYSASLNYERALSSGAGIGAQLSSERQALRDPGFSTWSGNASLFAYREIGPLTLVGTIGHGWLKADERLLLFPKARSERLHRATLGATFRNFRVGAFAPLVRASFERNRSSIEIYDYRKLRMEIGVSRAF